MPVPNGERAGTSNPYAPPRADLAATADGAQGGPGAPSASYSARIGARIIDFGFIFVAFLGTFYVALAWRWWDAEDPDWIPFAFILPGIIAESLLVAFRGRSLGKLAFGTRVELVGGGNPGLTKGTLLRELPVLLMPLLALVASNHAKSPTWLVALGAVYLVDAVFALRRDRRCLHDLLAGTRVVRRR